MTHNHPIGGGLSHLSRSLVHCCRVPTSAIPSFSHDGFAKRHTRGAERGSSLGSAPREDNAAATAFAISPPTGIMPPSPAPLTPRGLVGDGRCSNEIARILRKSVAIGIE